jgi:hypothetical protein
MRPLLRFRVATQTASALVGTDELRNRKVVGREGLLKLLHAGAGGEPEVFGEGVELEAVAVRSVPSWGAGAAVADRAEVVAALQRRRLPLIKDSCLRGMPQASQWMNRPPGASGSSRISARQRVPAGGADHDSGGERSWHRRCGRAGWSLQAQRRCW